jgi:hypothetical protein
VHAGTAGLARLAVGRNTRILRDVLMQRAAPCDVQHLNAATDREHRDAARHGDVSYRTFEIVGAAVDAVDTGMRGLAVQLGVDIRSAGQHDCIDALEQPLRVARILHDHGLPAGAHDRVDISAGECERA